MERLMTERRGAVSSAMHGLMWVGGALATVAAACVGAALAVFATATVLVIAVMGTALLTLAGAARRARSTVRANPSDPTLIEARKVGGHSWVAYGWDGQQR